MGIHNRNAGEIGRLGLSVPTLFASSLFPHPPASLMGSIGLPRFSMPITLCPSIIPLFAIGRCIRETKFRPRDPLDRSGLMIREREVESGEGVDWVDSTRWGFTDMVRCHAKRSAGSADGQPRDAGRCTSCGEPPVASQKNADWCEESDVLNGTPQPRISSKTNLTFQPISHLVGRCGTANSREPVPVARLRNSPSTLAPLLVSEESSSHILPQPSGNLRAGFLLWMGKTPEGRGA